MPSAETLDAAVIGAGSWGTAIARLLARKGHRVILWTRDPKLAYEINSQHENSRYLPGVSLPDQHFQASSRLVDIADRDAYFIAVPSFALRGVARQLKKTLGESAQQATWVSLTKGIEYDRADQGLLTMSQVLREELNSDRVFAMSGPSFAEEVARDYPTTVVLAGKSAHRAKRLQRVFMTERFRVYISEDRMGVELGGAIKNVIALAAGCSDGLGNGDNAKGALIARGLVEMTRLGIALGARKETFFGLAGLGDLVITCMSKRSRNRAVGERIGQGEALKEILVSMEMVAEGVYAVRAIHRFACERGIDLPITRAVYEVLYEGATPRKKLTELMTREPKREEI
ncbi:MAG: glycerol-3-phosphate dehydrogenase [Candidatus Fraserbacteria bacterium RBG_16_55_9]|uniref:Glycerol-3-phosphate dehydrogenase [NAD(P)+] n=1 Tax=Fraserbacteria sp. (strain RBG_16_55_9) TaxID=1817864 RepID=A0A1F5UUZ7_FRAXR|nr:MAG: glycerol-3-phosphate dehydrogenase [Candidatus Fraserbacteria bacterium RBG_16_55_9]